MTTIPSNILPFASLSAKDSASTQKTSDSGAFNAMLEAVSLGDASATEKNKKSSNPTDIMSSIQQFMANIDNSLLQIGNNDSSSAVSSASGAFNADGSITVDALLNQGGPLPEYLDRLGAQYDLSDAQKQALREVAIQFKDTNGSAADVQQIGAALKQIGIG